MNRFFSRISAAGASAALVISGALALGAPASAFGGALDFAPPSSGVAGVPVSVTMGTDSSVGGGPLPAGTVVSVTPVGSNSGAGAPFNVTASGNSFTTFTFVPPHVGSWTFQADGYTSRTSPTMQVNQVAVTTVVTAPNTVKVGVPTTITATVTPQGGSQLGVAGQIQFSIVGSGNIGAPVWLNQANPSVATLQWTPATLGTVQFRATFTPYKINGFPDVTCGNTCTSAVDTIQVTNTGVNVFLNNPPSLVAGVPATITANVSAIPSAGSALFTVNGQVIANGVPVQPNGTVSTTWTPSAPGQYTLAVQWTGNSGVTGGSQETVTVGTAPAQADTIVLQQVGGPAWVPNSTMALENGLSATFAPTTASGAPVTLSDTGPCNISGNTVIADQGSGQCILTASSPGGNGYGPVSQSYTILLVPGTQTVKLNAPGSGEVNVGKTLTLAKKNQGVTNAGQELVWKVTKGTSVCKLKFKSNGAVQLRILKKGKCNVQARASAVPGQWSPLTVKRHYRAV
jgi:hypothetical protein